ncbi:hypothetical protein SAMN05444149_101879 [Pseudosulfitobacter pseudonitzschiae]|nr:hypothetical protein SAMN05444149_101879 [Pseudosulfitobacter pseudonitzschiae]
MVIADLQVGLSLVVYCKTPRCDGRLWLNRDDAIARFGADLPLSTIRERARCTSCRSVGADTIVQYAGWTGVA